MNKKATWLFLFFTFFISVTFAQVHNLELSHFNKDRQLSKNTISWITQDKYGFLWIATEDGLYKFDGYSFTSFRAKLKEKGSISHNLLIALLYDSKGNLWAGSLGGIDRYNPLTNSFTNYLPQPKGNIRDPANFVHRLVEDRYGSIWVGTLGGLFKMDPSTGMMERFTLFNTGEKLSNLQIRSLIVDKSGTILWVGTENGLFKVDLKSHKTDHFFHKPNDANSLSNDVIRSIYEAKDGNLWIGTQKGLNKFDPKAEKVFRYYHNRFESTSISSDTILCMYEDKLNNLWVGTWRGLSILNIKTQKFHTYAKDPLNSNSLQGNIITAIYKDHSGELWIGTNRGLHKVVSKTRSFQHLSVTDKSTNNINSPITALLEGKDDTYWIGMEQYLIKFDRKRQSYDFFPFFENEEIYSLQKDNPNRIWMGTSQGLYALNLTNNEVKSYTHLINSEIWHIYMDNDQILWIGTVKGLYRFNPLTEEITHVKNEKGNPGSISENRVGAIVEDRQGILWIATQKGLNRLDKKTNRFTAFTHNERDSTSISCNVITQIYEDSRGLLWVGTTNGLNLFNRKNRKFTRYPDKHFELDEINGIVEDRKGNLWIKSTTGICKFNPIANTRHYYDANDGLQPDFNVGDNLVNSKGEVFFSGGTGITVFHPDSIIDNQFLPAVYITNFSIFNKPATFDTTLFKKPLVEVPPITLSYKQSIFSFEFAALNFSNPEKMQYAYKLEGLEDDWNLAGNRRFASYNNVPAGKTYTFRVKASPNYGLWSPKEASIRIYVRPPFWETIWFKTLAAISLCLGVVAVHRLRVRQYKKQKQVLEKQVSERTAQIREQKEQLEVQANEIERMNQLLKQDNEQLSENVKDLSQARVMQKQVSFEEFKRIYPDEDACYRFLTDLKWGKGYKCSKCANATYSSGPIPYSRRCSRCSTIERATTGTIFSRIQFPITKAFYMLFLLSNGKTMTIDELSQILDHSRQTCWTFRKKIMEVIATKRDTKKSQDGWSHYILHE